MEQLPFGITIAVNVVAMIAGIALFMITLVSLFRTIVIPRSLNSTLSQIVMAGVLFSARSIARFRRTYRGRDSVLAWSGPSFIFVILVTWITLFILSYGLMIFAVSTSSLGDAIRQSGSSLLTLGFAAGQGDEQTFIDFLAAATGPIVIALMIGVLPTIYSLYLEREKPVATLSSMAGDPAWGPEYIVRMSLTGTADELPETFATWSRWAVSVQLSHMTYPMLIHVRSATATRNYAVALLAMLDAAVIKLSLNTQFPRAQAFLLLLNGSVAMDQLFEKASQQQSLRRSLPLANYWRHTSGPIAPSVDIHAVSPQMQAAQTAAARDAMRDLTPEDVAALAQGEAKPIQLTREEFNQAYAMVKESGFPVDRDEDTAWEVFSHFRRRYEYSAYGLLRILDAVPAPWSGDRIIPTKVQWPSLSIPILHEQASTATSPDDSSNPPEPDAAHR
jgi:hypothetical protein